MFKITRSFVFFVFTIVWFALVFGCSSASSVVKNAPQWVSAADEVYNSRDYLNAVGYGESRQVAENGALAQLAKNIRQNVVASSDAAKSIVGNDQEGYDTNYDYFATVEAASTVKDIPGVNFREVWDAPDGTVYVLAQLNREEVGRYFRKQIDERTAVIESEILYANKNSGTFEALAALKNASQEAVVNQDHMEMLAGINPDMYRLVSPDYVSAAAVAVLAFREQEKVKIFVSVEGDSSDRICDAFKTVVSDSGLKLTEKIEDARYKLDAKIEMTEIEGNKKYEYVRFVLSAQLIDMATQKVLVPYSENGREAHISQTEAVQRAYRTVEELVASNYSSVLASYLDTLR